jgi:hypothetical protein
VDRRPDVGEKVVIRMPGNSLDQRVVTVIEMASKTVVRVNLGNGEERLVPLSKIF